MPQSWYILSQQGIIVHSSHHDFHLFFESVDLHHDLGQGIPLHGTVEGSDSPGLTRVPLWLYQLVVDHSSASSCIEKNSIAGSTSNCSFHRLLATDLSLDKVNFLGLREGSSKLNESSFDLSVGFLLMQHSAAKCPGCPHL